MAIVIHIIQKDGDTNNVESTIIDLHNILELHCVYPNKGDGEQDTNDDLYNAQVEGSVINEVDFTLLSGDVRHINVTISTVFRIICDEGIIIETTNPQKFEEAYLRALTVGGVNAPE